MALMRSKMRTVESTTVSAMRSTRRERGDGGEGDGKNFGTSDGGELVEQVDGEVGLRERGGDGPGLGNVVGVEPANDGPLRGR